MKSNKKRFRKGTAILLAFNMMVSLVPVMPGSAINVKAGGGTATEPSVSAYATKEQLMDDTFAPKEDGTADNIGKLVFGKNESGNAQEWYILGEDKGVNNENGDNTIIFAASPIIASGQQFNDDAQITIATDATDYGKYENPPSVVNANHYGASVLRDKLQEMADDITYFTTAEQYMMNAITVTTKDEKNNLNYTTTDKLYALTADGKKKQTIKAGSNDKKVLQMQTYWDKGNIFWLRSTYGTRALAAYASSNTLIYAVNSTHAVRPASNLNLSSVLFASAATAASSGTAESGTIATGKAAMTLRLDGSDKNIGTVMYNTTTGNIKATSTPNNK